VIPRTGMLLSRQDAYGRPIFAVESGSRMRAKRTLFTTSSAGLATLDWPVIAELGRQYEGILVDIGGIVYFDDPVELVYTYRTSCHLKAQGVQISLGPMDILRLSRGANPASLGLEDAEWNTANSRGWEETIGHWCQLAVPIPGAIEKLMALRPARIAIVANQPHEMFAALRRDNVLRACDVIFLDSWCGFSKPDLNIFRYALRRLSVDPTKALMIGDRLDNDIEPAERMRLNTLWIRRRLWSGSLSTSDVPTKWHQRFVEEMNGDRSFLDGASRPSVVNYFSVPRQEIKCQ
jgi:HAD superfamily hydrolase (TIGR01549 family)